MSARIAVVSLVLILGLVNWFIAGKEKHLAEGRIVYLDLAPVDPRSLMQGDYMALRFRVANAAQSALQYTEGTRNVFASDGYIVASLDDRNIASFKRLYAEETLAEGELLMRYRIRNGAMKFATNAFFFQEGHAKYYEEARYGQFRVDKRGELLLTAMYDKDLNKLEPGEEG